MAVTIRTGANGSYKSAYVMWFVILPALKAGRTVVTNLEGIQPIEVMAERLEIEFPSTAKLFRIFSRDVKGVDLWRHFFCWCPLNALIVIDECQDIYSKNVGFRMDKYMYRPLEEFLPNLPEGYQDFFDSRHTPVDMSKLSKAEVDDRGQAEYTEDGKIVYPLSFNEGFMRHRKYNWDIELLSPDWKQIDSGVKACAEQAFFHKSRDGYPFCKRKPYIFKHDKTVASVKIPEKKDPNKFTEKIPLDVHLLYKSTGTGAITKAGGMNTLFRDWRIWAVSILLIITLGNLIYGLSNMVFGSSEEVTQQEVEDTSTVHGQGLKDGKAGSQTASTVHRGGNNHPTGDNGNAQSVSVSSVPPFFGFDGLKSLYVTAFVLDFDRSRGKIDYAKTHISLVGETLNGDEYVFNETYLRYRNIDFVFIDECLLELRFEQQKTLVTCMPINKRRMKVEEEPEPSALNLANVEQPEISLF